MAIYKSPLYTEEGRLRGCYVYLLLCREEGSPNGYMKIGRTQNIGSRLSELRVGCPIPPLHFAFVELNTKSAQKGVELGLHRRFKERRARGEWFRFDFRNSDDKVEFNAAVTEVFGRLKIKSCHWTHIDVPAYDAYTKAAQRDYFRRNRKKELALMKMRRARSRVLAA